MVLASLMFGNDLNGVGAIAIINSIKGVDALFCFLFFIFFHQQACAQYLEP